MLSSGRSDQTEPTRLPRVVLEDVSGGQRKILTLEEASERETYLHF